MNMKTDRIFYYIGVRFDERAMAYSYLCQDLSVRVGDDVLVPVYDAEERIGKVVTAAFYSVDDVPYPLEKTKSVIRKIPSEETEAEIEELVSALNTLKTARIQNDSDDTAPVSEKPSPDPSKDTHVSSHTDTVANILTVFIITPILTLIFGLILAFILILLGWEADNGIWAPFALALPIAIAFCIYAIESPTPPQSTKPVKRHSHSGTGGSGVWLPGCPEEELFSSMDDAFDFDGDGHLDDVESSTKCDIFFGDDD